MAGRRWPALVDPDEYLAPAPARVIRAPWWAAFCEDLARYRAHYDGHLLKPLLLEQGVWALLAYRLSSGLQAAAPPGARGVARLLSALLQKVVEVVTGISLPADATIGPGLYIGHFGPIVINSDAVIGSGCNISQGVSIAVAGRGARRGVPVIGDRVYVGANAVICGPITIGDDAVIGANSLVNCDVPDSGTAVGVPATTVNLHGTGGMGLHQRRVPPAAPAGGTATPGVRERRPPPSTRQRGRR